MDPKEFYKFCPKCGGALEEPLDEYSKCQNCDFKVFFNVAACAGVIIENDKGQILLTKRGFDPGKGRMDLPGGFIKPGETAVQAAEREVGEELGVPVQNLVIFGAYPNIYHYQGVAVPLMDIYFTGTITSGDIKPSDDVVGFSWVPKEEVMSQDLWSESVINSLKDYLNH